MGPNFPKNTVYNGLRHVWNATAANALVHALAHLRAFRY